MKMVDALPVLVTAKHVTILRPALNVMMVTITIPIKANVPSVKSLVLEFRYLIVPLLYLYL